MTRIYLMLAVLMTTSCVVEDDSLILDTEFGTATLRQCSRWSPDSEEFFRPSESEIDRLERSLDSIASLTPTECCNASRIANPRDYMRQYLGYVSDGRRFIYVNAVLRGVIISEMSRQPFLVCDGGTSAWGVSYNIDADEFVSLAINGGA